MTTQFCKMDMAMTVEVENDLYAPLVYNTPPQDNQDRVDQDRVDQDREECLRREIELARNIEMFRRWALNPEDNLTQIQIHSTRKKSFKPKCTHSVM